MKGGYILKRLIAHFISLVLTLMAIIFNAAQVKTTENLIWSIPYIISNCAVMFFLLLSLLKKPKDVNESLPMFLIAVLSTNFFFFIILFGRLFPMGPQNQMLINIDKYMHLLALPFYIWGVITLGRRLTVLPEANSLQTHGAYHFSRHPLYACYIYWFVLQNLTYQTWSCLILSVVQISLIVIRAKYEEKILEKNFPEYIAYKRTVWWIGRFSNNSK